MKIYTEINYEWLDGQLIEISSESFNYNGPLTLCSGGTADTVEDIIEDPVGVVQEQIHGGAEQFGENLQEGIESGSDALVHDDLESAINTNIDTMHDYGQAVNTVVADELTRWSDAALGFAQDVGEFMGVGGDDGKDVAVPDKLKAVKQNLKNKQVANLKVNKSLGQGRSSLRIAR